MNLDAESKFKQLLTLKKETQRKIDENVEEIKILTQKIEHFDIVDWWSCWDCHNAEECGEECFSGCDLPREMWDDRRKILEKEVN
ncbi:hypothetical protein [Candidatus Lokiarchaeum ossiferum]|uniref:hypothetical protein n=1 Tax=Candidatus Lokiarchaeum ossiferum TaxID=2951803 RepID=UPI00352E20BC